MGGGRRSERERRGRERERERERERRRGGLLSQQMVFLING